MTAPPQLWIVRALWLVLPFTLLPHLGAATEGADGAVPVVVTVLFWLLWGTGLVASMVAFPSTVTAVRTVAPLAPVASVLACAVELPDAAGWAGLVVGAVTAVLVMAAPIGDWFVDGPSYGDERRMALRPPVALLLGPVEVAWVMTVGPLLAGILLLADRTWIIGAGLAAVGLATTWWGAIALWRLSRRWIVLVPAGLTLVDDMALAEPILLQRSAITRLGPAHEGTTALDLSVAAPGLVLEAALSAPVELVPAVRSRNAVAEPTTAGAVLFVPSRPATLLDDAERRGIAVDRS